MSPFLIPDRTKTVSNKLIIHLWLIITFMGDTAGIPVVNKFHHDKTLRVLLFFKRNSEQKG